MKFEIFQEIVSTIKLADEKINKVYESGIDLIDVVDKHDRAISLLLNAYYGEEGSEMLDWFMYEKFSDNRKPLKAKKDGKEICKDLKQLWKYCEDYRNSKDFVECKLKIPLTEEERLNILKKMFS